MSSDAKLWAVFWITLGTFLISMVLTIEYYNNLSSQRQTEAWIVCVKEGGKPMHVTMNGVSGTTFTCVRE